MKRLLTLIALTATLALPAIAAPKKSEKPAAEKAAQPAPDFTGNYERAGDSKAVFILHVRQAGNNAELEYSASKADGTGAAPDGNGSGSLNDKGALEFTFEDSFGNKGTGTLKKTGKSFQLDLKAVTINEPRAVKLYGVIALRKSVSRDN